MKTITISHRLYMRAVQSRRKQVAAMRRQGLTWAAIGKALGVTRQRAQQLGTKK